VLVVSLPWTGQTWHGTKRSGDQGLPAVIRSQEESWGERQQSRQRCEQLGREKGGSRHGRVRDWAAGTLLAAMYRARAWQRMGEPLSGSQTPHLNPRMDSRFAEQQPSGRREKKFRVVRDRKSLFQLIYIPYWANNSCVLGATG